MKCRRTLLLQYSSTGPMGESKTSSNISKVILK
jgi:hypothetical protein